MTQEPISHAGQTYPGNAEWLTHENPHLLFTELAREQGPVVPLSSKGKLVVINGLETITEVLKGQADKLRRPVLESARNDPFSYVRERIVESKDGKLHEEQRKIMLKVIHDCVMSRIPDMESALSQATDMITGEIAIGRPIDPELAVGAGTLLYVHRIVFGESLPRELAFEIASEMGSLNFSRENNWIRVERFRWDLAPSDWNHRTFDGLDFQEWSEVFHGKTVEQYIGKLEKKISEEKHSFDPDRLRGIIDGLLKANDEYQSHSRSGPQLKEEDIVLGSLIHLFGITRGLLIIFILYALHYMVAYPEIQSAIQRELDDAMAKGIQPGFSSRQYLPFTEACMWEILRHASVAALAGLGYEAKEEIMAAGHKLDKGTVLFINYYSATRDERYWPNPELFDPGRFLDKEGKVNRDQINKFLPFGAGHHRCVGGPNWGYVNMMTLFPMLLARCRFEMAPSTPHRLGQHATPFLIPHNYELIATRRGPA